MKKVLFLLTISVCVASSFLCYGCNHASASIVPPKSTMYSHLNVQTVGEDFDFASLPPKRSAKNEFWDVSDVDISSVNKDKKLIAFTFDDTPSSTLENILSVFAQFNEQNPDCLASATLFCNGNLLSNNAFANLSAALTLGWELGNHTFSHPDITNIPLASVLEEIAATETLLSKVDKKNEHLFRPPYGRINESVKSELSVPIIEWTIDTLDWTGVSASEIYDTVFSQKFSGAIVLMHDGYPNTVTALKRLLPDLKDAGYQVTSVSKMAKAHDCPLKNGGAYIRARKKGSG